MTLVYHQQYTFSFEIVFQSHHSGNLSEQIWDCYQCILHVTATCNLRSESTFLRMPQDNRRTNYPRSLLR
jgi:hypothetical protein